MEKENVSISEKVINPKMTVARGRELAGLIDIANKAAGARVAKSVVFFIDLIDEQIKGVQNGSSTESK